MASETKPRRDWKKIFRRLRIAVLFFIFLLVCAALYLNRAGLPGFIKDPLLEKLRERGINLQASKLRWSWTRGIVGENVIFAGTNSAATGTSPQFSAKEINVRLKSILQIGAVVLRRGEFHWRVGTNEPLREIAAHNIEAELRFLSGDRWELERLQGEFAGAKLSATGSITNASALKDWKIFQRKQKRRGDFQERLDQFAKILERIKFSSSPELSVLVQGDALDPQSFSGSILLSAPSAATPWGDVDAGLLTVKLLQGGTNKLLRGEVKLEAGDVKTEWADAKKLEASAHLALMDGDTNHVSAELVLSADEFLTKWGSGTNAHFTANWIQPLSNALPESGRVELRLADGKTKWGKAAQVHLAAELLDSQSKTNPADESWGRWQKIAPLNVNWQCELAGVHSEKIEAEQLDCAGSWSAPELKLEKIHSRLYGGGIDATAELNIATRAVGFETTWDFDTHKIEPLLTEGGRAWMEKFSWELPPNAHGGGSAILPPWTNAHPDWRAEVLPTLALSGEFSAGNGAYRSVPVTSARSHIIFTNMNWVLPDLAVTRPEGGAELFYRVDELTKNFYWKITNATLDPKAARPLLETNAQRGLDLFVLTSPPRVNGELWGRFNEPEQTSFRGQIALSNFTFRGESASRFESGIELTNAYIVLTAPKMFRGDGELTADAMGFDIHSKKLYFTNGFSTVEPMAVARAIGKKTEKNFAPYVFLTPPTVHGRGMIQIRSSEQPDWGDMEFEVDTGPFRWLKFNPTHVTGTVLWRGESLVLTNVAADFYGGKTFGDAAFDFSPGNGTDYHFDIRGSNVNVHLLSADLSAATNKLEGLLSGRLAVTNANTRDLKSWQGFGRVHIKDGMIWEMPIFGIFSPVLNAVWPNLGSTRVNEGKAKFIITNSVVFSDDMEFHALALRMNYRGTVDFDKNVDARVEAALLREVWGIGPVVSTVFWPITKMFEYKVTGTLNHPKTEPLYVFPKLLMLPFQPFYLLKGLMPEGAKQAEQYQFQDPNPPPPETEKEKN